MGLDDNIQRIRAARREAEEARNREAALRETQGAANVEKASEALKELGWSAVDVLGRGDVPMYAEMAMVRLAPPMSFFDGGYTLKIRSGRLWSLDGFSLALDRDGIFYNARVWRLGAGAAADSVVASTTNGRTLYSDYLRSSLNTRAESVTRRRSLPGGYTTQRKIEPVGFPPAYSVDFNPGYGYFMMGDKLMAGNERTYEPFEEKLAGYLETMLR